LERQIDVPCRKLKVEIWSSPSQFGCWGTLNYSFENKGESWNFLNFCGVLLSKMTYSKECNKKKFISVSTTRILYAPNIYLIIVHLIYQIRSFFIKSEMLMFYSVVMAAIGALAELWKKSISFCHVCPHGTSRILDVLLWNLIFEYFWKNCIEN
jgi:hypothetical protein